MVSPGGTLLLAAAGGSSLVLLYRVVFIGSRFPPSVLGGLADLLTWLWESASPDTQQRRHASPCRPLGTGGSSLPPLGQGLVHLIGNTPVIRIKSLSEQTGCEILAKAELLNPGGSVKDRVALEIVQEALAEGRLAPGGLVTEGTVGSTGVSLAMCAAAYGCRVFIAMPDDAAIEKAQMLQALGAEVQRCRPVSITHPDHFVNVARRRAEEQPNAVFADQFENAANYRAHLKTGREIWEQTGGRIDAFVSGAGTGGTIAGVSCCLKQLRPEVQVYLVDPPGSGLYNKVTRGVMYAAEEAEGKRLRHPFDTITEGIGINRITSNFARAQIDEAFKGTDQEAVEMAHYLLRNEGLFVGSSAAMNCVGAVKAARRLGPGHTIVTVLCDGGHRHLSKFHSPLYLQQHGLSPAASGAGLEFVG
ncbi:hypothetical protein D9Q98_003567 [Chlorella vulgaris]|uniref:cysteine synthase n=1 Tax=Chlorella vulgaris TaxID=3077 RepID=A0A9D4YZJ7_CHLVU|nr:hypothetical protein D9Q98_003567 [Chlorella vulgaris]